MAAWACAEGWPSAADAMPCGGADAIVSLLQVMMLLVLLLIMLLLVFMLLMLTADAIVALLQKLQRSEVEEECRALEKKGYTGGAWVARMMRTSMALVEQRVRAFACSRLMLC